MSCCGFRQLPADAMPAHMRWLLPSLSVLLASCRFSLRQLVPVSQATSAGAKDQEAENFLEKKFKGNPQLSFEEAVQTAIAALQVHDAAW